MSQTVEKALTLWGLTGSDYRLIAARENSVYRVAVADGQVALRLHRQNYRSDAELRSELQWMAAVKAGGISVPAPIPATDGDILQVVDDVQVDILTWMSGTPVSDRLPTLTGHDRTRLFYNLGQEMAKLHDISDNWVPPNGFTRCTWDQAALLGSDPLWGKFWENPGLTASERQLLVTMREKANAELSRLQGSLDFGLIHADLVGENVMVHEETLSLIDFDDGGFGFRLFDIATVLLKRTTEDDYAQLKSALIDGYSNVRVIDLKALDLFLLLRSATYVGWNILRMDEPGAGQRNERFINTTCTLAQEYLAS